MSLLDEETNPLLKPLCARLERWRSEAGLKTHPHLQKSLQDGLEVAGNAGVEEDLVIFVIALCEWWFRVFRPSEAGLRRVLTQRLNNSHYSPHSPFARMILTTHNVPSAITEIVDRHLAHLWEPEASEELNGVFREKFLDKKEKMVRELARPFLLSEYKTLPPRRGGYPDWAPWVAAFTVYCRAHKGCSERQDSGPVDTASAIVKALRGNTPDKSAFHRKKREIRIKAPKLVEAIIQAYEKATISKVQDERIKPLIDEDCFPSLMRSGGWSLLIEQRHASTESSPSSVKS